MTSHASPDPVTVDPLGMCNGLAQPSFRAQCTGPPHPVHHSSEFGMLFTVGEILEQPGPMRSQNDGVNALLFPLVVSYRSDLLWFAWFALNDDNRWLPGERPRVQIRPRKRVTMLYFLYIYHDLSIVTCFSEVVVELW